MTFTPLLKRPWGTKPRTTAWLFGSQVFARFGQYQARAKIKIMGLSMNRLTIETIDVDDPQQIDSLMAQILAESRARIKAEIAEGKRAGLLDEHGKLLVHELPDDMREDAAQDFGG